MTTMHETAFDWNAAPVRVENVTIRSLDPERLAVFYRTALGLETISADKEGIVLGAGEKPLLALIGDPQLKPGDPSSAGLFHTAFLLPSRDDLAAWLVHAQSLGLDLSGAADHGVSEALYLSDPDGNGIEIYTDRPPAGWRQSDGAISMSSERLDLVALAETAAQTWDGFPADGFIGHVHVQVGDVAAAEPFYHDVLGLEVTARRPGASFFGAGGYHHQLAANHWRSPKAGVRDPNQAGLAEIALTVAPEAAEEIADRAAQTGARFERLADGLALSDPWGTRLTIAVRETH